MGFLDVGGDLLDGFDGIFADDPFGPQPLPQHCPCCLNREAAQAAQIREFYRRLEIEAARAYFWPLSETW